MYGVVADPWTGSVPDDSDYVVATGLRLTKNGSLSSISLNKVPTSLSTVGVH